MWKFVCLLSVSQWISDLKTVKYFEVQFSEHACNTVKVYGIDVQYYCTFYQQSYSTFLNNSLYHHRSSSFHFTVYKMLLFLSTHVDFSHSDFFRRTSLDLYIKSIIFISLTHSNSLQSFIQSSIYYDYLYLKIFIEPYW